MVTANGTDFYMPTRWQSTLGELLERAIEKDPGELAQLLMLLEERDRGLENKINLRPYSGWTSYGPGAVKFGGSTGNVVDAGQYQFDGDFINLEIGWTMSGGGAGAVGALTIDLPVATVAPPGTTNSFPHIGFAHGIDQGVQRYPSGLVYTNFDFGTRTAYVQSSATAAQSSWSNAVPWNWGATDQGSANIRYRWR